VELKVCCTYRPADRENVQVVKAAQRKLSGGLGRDGVWGGDHCFEVEGLYPKRNLVSQFVLGRIHCEI
jgi:hypothetical protein